MEGYFFSCHIPFYFIRYLDERVISSSLGVKGKYVRLRVRHCDRDQSVLPEFRTHILRHQILVELNSENGCLNSFKTILKLEYSTLITMKSLILKISNNWRTRRFEKLIVFFKPITPIEGRYKVHDFDGFSYFYEPVVTKRQNIKEL